MSTPFREIQPWRTSKVAELAEAMRTSKNYDLIPILCDLLEEADYEDTAELIKMRGSQDWLTNVTFVAKIHSPLTEQAVRTIEEMIKKMNGRPSWQPMPEEDSYTDDDYPRNEVLTYERVMTLASEISEEGKNHVGVKWWNDKYLTQYGTETWRDNFKSEVFWKAYALITGDDTVKDEHFFSCSC